MSRKGYHHVTRDLRCQIYALNASGNSLRSIARQLGVHASTVSREIKRNTGKRGYRYAQAHTMAQQRRSKASRHLKKMTASLIVLIREKIAEGWSPEQTAGRLTVEGTPISHETIYKHIWQDKKNGGTLYKNLRHSGKKYNKRSAKTAGRGLIPNRVDISLRPEIVEHKSRIGDFEGDTIIGAKHKGAILSYVDRSSKYTFLAKLEQKRAELVVKATKDKLENLPHKLYTITFDNGKEFAGHEKMREMLDVEIFFATPYHSWERGLNEHTNGLVRQYLPKSTDFSKVTHEVVQNIQERLNHRPRKILNFKTPHEIFILGLKIDDHVALRC